MSLRADDVWTDVIVSELLHNDLFLALSKSIKSSTNRLLIYPKLLLNVHSPTYHSQTLFDHPQYQLQTWASCQKPMLTSLLSSHSMERVPLVQR